MIKGSHSWIVCQICDSPIKDTIGGTCKCGNVKVSVEKETGVVTTMAEEGDQIIYDTE